MAAGVSGRLRIMEYIDARHERRAIRPERRRPPMDGEWPPELTVKSTAAQILGASSACSRFDKQPLVTKFEISIEALPGMYMAKGYAACAYQKRKRSNASVSYEPHHKHRSAPFASSHLPKQSSVADNARLATCRIIDWVI
jgi:hypothetical protein